jgi:hypothetical protein
VVSLAGSQPPPIGVSTDSESTRTRRFNCCDAASELQCILPQQEDLAALTGIELRLGPLSLGEDAFRRSHVQKEVEIGILW